MFYAFDEPFGKGCTQGDYRDNKHLHYAGSVFCFSTKEARDQYVSENHRLLRKRFF